MSHTSHSHTEKTEQDRRISYQEVSFPNLSHFPHRLLGMTRIVGTGMVPGIPFTCSQIYSDTPSTQYTKAHHRSDHAEYLKERRHPPSSSLGNVLH